MSRAFWIPFFILGVGTALVFDNLAVTIGVDLIAGSFIFPLMIIAQGKRIP